MKTKKLKRFVCLLLAFVVLLSMPLNTQAHAAVAVPWVMYAIITYLASLGITFTASGGVDAMIQAMEEKVDEYQKQAEIIDFYDIVRSGLKIVPPPNGGPNWDKNKGYFFLAFNAAMALTAFADWLVSDGGWGLGSTVENELSIKYGFPRLTSQEELVIFVNRGKYVDAKRINGYYAYRYTLGEFENYTTAELPLRGFLNSGSTIELLLDSDYCLYYVYADGTKTKQFDFNDMLSAYSYQITDIKEICFFNYYSSLEYALPCFIMNDGNLLYILNSSFGYGYPSDEFVVLDTVTSIDVPPEITLPSFTLDEGILLDTGATAAETLEELGELFETVFTDTGTIPQPQPQVITDPATQPVPTPAPTTPPIQDVDDLGLPTLGEAVFNKFPFSLPRDLKRIAEILNAEPVTPYWEVDLFAPLADDISFAGDTTLRIDLSEYEALGQISRWASVIGFCIMLIIITKGVIKW